ncbi:YvrJ family protein [Lysinibacillus yapensis]|uniref:YvrJ family protein n=1 Tax=Ureibacillus yapensis TaxID=2304605 RepID=A0A396S6Q0_9BACL|nr:YvrJ family protein [Lysinibacillus yapensis]RHW35789.1 YvrJ family protein [Lysinibacillus yapensis]
MIEGLDFVQILGDVGFPAAIAVYLLVRYERKLDKLRESIDALSDDLNQSK